MAAALRFIITAVLNWLRGLVLDKVKEASKAKEIKDKAHAEAEALKKAKTAQEVEDATKDSLNGL